MVDKVILEKIKEIVDQSKPDGIVARLKSKSELWEEIIEYTSSISDLQNKSEQIYLYYHQLSEKPKCGCGNKLRFRTFFTGYSEFCSDRKCEYMNKVSRKKACATMLSQGGIGLANPATMAKARKTLGLNHGENISNPGQIHSHREDMKINNPVFNDDVRHRLQQHYMDKYGVDNPAQIHMDPKTLELLKNRDYLKEQFSLYSINDLSNKLGISVNLLNRYLLKHGLREKYESIPEKQIYEYLTVDLQLTVKRRDRTLLSNGKELDFLIDDYKIAIEHCGLYYHREDIEKGRMDRNYHYSKYEICKSKGYRLITIFEDEWLEKQDQIKTFLKYIFQKSNIKIFARNTVVKKITKSESYLFCEKHHILGGANNGTDHIGLFYNDELVAVGVFMNMGNIKFERLHEYKSPYNLIRFCTGKKTIVGGFSKIMKYFIGLDLADVIITYADRRFSDGDLYLKNGFVSDGVDPPSYWYIKDQKRYHKSNFRLKNIYPLMDDKSINSEPKITELLGFDRIWDCGKLRFRYEIKRDKVG